MFRSLDSRGNGVRRVSTVRLLLAQAPVRYLATQRVIIDGSQTTLIRGLWGIFGHGNTGLSLAALVPGRQFTGRHGCGPTGLAMEWAG